MKKGLRVVCVLVFVIGLLSFSLAWEKRKSDIEPSRSFVVVYYEAQTTPDGKKTITGWRTRYVKANGEWRVVLHGSDVSAAFASDPAAFSRTSSPVFAGTSEGVFGKASGSNERKSLGSSPPAMSPSPLEGIEKQFHSHNFLKNHGQLVRKDVVAGFEVYVLRAVSDENPNYWTESSISPLTGRTALRIVSHNLDGTEYIMEAVKVEFKDVPDNLNEDIESLPNTGKLGDNTTPPK